MGGRGSKARTRVDAHAPGPVAVLDPPTETTPPSDLAERVEQYLDQAQRRTIHTGEQGGLKEELTLPDGTKVFSKSYTPEDGDQGRFVIDAEELGGLIAAAINAPVPRVHRRGDELRVFTEWADGTPLHTARRRRDGAAREQAMLDSPAGKRLGLLDVLTGNHDRNPTNILVTNDDQLTGIDQGNAFTAARWIVAEPTPRAVESRAVAFMEGPGSQHFVHPDNHTAFGPNPLTPGDVAEIRTRLTALRPAFERRGRGEWLDAALITTDRLGHHATGTTSIFDD